PLVRGGGQRQKAARTRLTSVSSAAPPSCPFRPSRRPFANEKPSNIEFSCRPESNRYAPVRQTALTLNRLHPGGQLQRFVIHTRLLVCLFVLLERQVQWQT